MPVDETPGPKPDMQGTSDLMTEAGVFLTRLIARGFFRAGQDTARDASQISPRLTEEATRLGGKL